jgi:putative AdoMet-dependent methyltransferase
MPEEDAFTPESFDGWADSYDRDVLSQTTFPFAGYEQALSAVVRLAEARSGMTILDLGTGTGNLALRFAKLGCTLWCTDFSEPMLAKARLKLRQAHFLLHDLRAPWPEELDLRFDRIVSAYVFHHFELGEKVDLCRLLAMRHLVPGGRLVIADISFRDNGSMEGFARSIGDLWEQEPFWLADEAVQALKQAGLEPEYVQVSPCAGVYAFTA